MIEALAHLIVGALIGFILHTMYVFLCLVIQAALESTSSKFFGKLPSNFYASILIFLALLGLVRLTDYPSAMVETLRTGPASNLWEGGAIRYAQLVTRAHVAFLTGILCGILSSVLVDLSRSSGRLDQHRGLSRMIGWGVVALSLLVLLSPLIERITASLTSLEVGPVGKITFASPQPTSSKGATFTAGVGSSSNSTIRTSDIADWLRALKGLPTRAKNKNDKMCFGTIKRDQEYIRILSRNSTNRTTSDKSPGNGEIESSIKQAIDKEEAFFGLTSQLPLCLGQYAENFADYRLLLIDVKPMIHVFSALLSCQERRRSAEHKAADDKNTNVQTKSTCVEELTERVKKDDDVKKIFNNAGDSIKLMAAQLSLSGIESTKNHCSNLVSASDIDVSGSIVSLFESETPLPYKKIALSYLLTAIEASDTAAIELDSWLTKASVNNHKTVAEQWYIIRVKTEIAIILQKLIENREQSAVYRDFMEDLVASFEKILPYQSITEWSESCNQTDESYMERLMFSIYITNLNEYVRSASDIANVRQYVVERASQLKNINMRCLSDIPGFEQQLDAWRANFLTSHASALVAASYSSQMFAKSPGKQKQAQDDAREDLREALLLLERQDNAQKQPATAPASKRCSDESENVVPKSTFLGKWQWSSLRSNARTLLLQIGEDSN